MFTGIVETTGTVGAVRDEEGGRRLEIETDLEDLSHGASIAVDGACLTAEAVRADGFSLFCSTETLDRTTLSGVEEGSQVNLERALAADGRLDGHFVQGHVDTTAEVVGIERVDDDWTFEFSMPEEIGRYVVEKGSIALDGISLTVAERREGTVTVAVIPTTYEETAMSALEPGDSVNVEVDVIAKYVERLLDGHR